MDEPMDCSESGPSEARPWYQDVISYNKHLPYADQLGDEASQLLKDIKSNLSRAVQMRELWPGALYWTNRLSSYLRVYGVQFTKEDHIALVKLLYQLVTIPGVESPLLHSWCSILANLLKKRRLLSPDDLQLPWRPMFAVIKRVFQSKYRQLGMKVYSSQTSNAVHQLLSQVRCYYPIESTQEMLDEWRPLLCPFDMSMVEGVNLLSEFLPTLVHPHHHQATIRLWFDEFLGLWLSANNSIQWDEFWVKLYTRLAKHTIGYIDWSPYMPQIFTKILWSFQLPMGPKELQVAPSKKDNLGGDKPAILIISMLGGASPAQDHLDQLMIALESYYHPSNIGHHTKKLLHFLKTLTCQFIYRLKQERHRKPTWEPAVPSEKRLTEHDIDRFVQSVLPAMRLAVFSRVGMMDAATAIQCLALVRPEKVLPDLMERTYAALETLTEPHQVIGTLSCVTYVCRPLIEGGANGRYPEGRRHLFSLLTLALPGIDPNDFRKTLVSSMLISSLLSMVPVVDCSAAVGVVDMTEEEAELCSQTSQFEEFVVQLLDRCFSLIENTGLEQVTALDRIVSSVAGDNHETLMGVGITTVIQTTLVQSSADIFQVALDKLFRFATSRVFESEVAGKMCADMCSSAAKVRPVITLRRFVPACTAAIERILEDPEQLTTETPDIELVWNIQLLSRVIGSNSGLSSEHIDSLISCLTKCVHLKSKTASKNAAEAVANILACHTLSYPRLAQSISTSLDLPPQEHLYIRDWAAQCSKADLQVSWRTPSNDDLQLVDRVLQVFLQPELTRLQRLMDGTEDMDKDTLHQSLVLVDCIVLGAAPYLPAWTGPQVPGCPTSSTSLKRGFYTTAPSDMKQPPEQFSRKTIAQFIHKLIGHVTKHRDDETKNLTLLVKIVKTLLTFFGCGRAEFESKWRGFTMVKTPMENRLDGRYRYTRQLLVARTNLQHEMRLSERIMAPLTELHLQLLQDLLMMSVSTYAEVRVKAQEVLHFSLDGHLFSGRLLLPQVLPYLSNSKDVSHEQFKGALHVLMLGPMMSVVVHDWRHMRNTLPAIVKADHSEKPSILKLISKLEAHIQNSYDCCSLKFRVTDGCVEAAARLNSPLSRDDLTDGGRSLQELNTALLQAYNSTIETLADIVEHGNLQWRYSQMAIKFIVMLLRPDHPLPVRGVSLLVNSLIHDSLAIRKVAIFSMAQVLQQLKRAHPMVPVDLATASGVAVTDPLKVPPGERQDNKWLCLDETRVESEQDYDSNSNTIHKTHWGFYCWPRTLYRYAPMDQQPKLNRTSHELSESERAVYIAFSSEEFVTKLVTFLSLEENKGQDKYSHKRVAMFKCLFRNYGSGKIAELFKPHLEKLAVDPQDNNQRCASEIIAGMVVGSKHWSYSIVHEMLAWLQPLIKRVLGAITPDTVDDWYHCFSDISANRAPQRVYWLLRLLMDNPINSSNGAFIDASALSLLQVGLAQQEWRIPTLLHSSLLYLTPHFSHPFKAVREKIGWLVSQLIMTDTDMSTPLFNPKRAELVHLFARHIPPPQELVGVAQDSETLRICKTAMLTITYSYHCCYSEYYELLAMLLPLVAYDNDDELSTMIKQLCVMMSRSEISSSVIPSVLLAVRQVLNSKLWKMKLPMLQLLQVLVFGNLFMFLSVRQELTDLLLSLMHDHQIEVRELAASTVSGLVRCGFIATPQDQLKVTFMKRSRVKLPNKRVARASSSPASGQLEETDSSENGYEVGLVRRHCGVLGLAALVESCPYTVPDWLPDVLDELTLHLNDPAPIPDTVKKATSEFKRTHYDNWREHKLQFTEDQLANLTDLLVSPSYYA